VVTEERRALVVGGDCTVLLGVFLGLPRGMRLWFIDGHADFLDGDTSPTGEAADMDLAILTGMAHRECWEAPGPSWTQAPWSCSDIALTNSAPMLRARMPGSILPSVRSPPFEIRERGARAVGQEVAADNRRQKTWLHLDLDVLDEQALPAVTYP
jgi:arginase